MGSYNDLLTWLGLPASLHSLGTFPILRSFPQKNTQRKRLKIKQRVSKRPVLYVYVQTFVEGKKIFLPTNLYVRFVNKYEVLCKDFFYKYNMKMSLKGL
jgi:hypothetical protein